MQPITLSVLIISWNVRDLLRACLVSLDTSLKASGLHERCEILVVDSSSHDGSAAMVAAEFPHVRLFAQSDNIGFVRGNNLALAHARGDAVFLLNPDTVVLDDAIARLLHALYANPAIGMVGPHTRNSDGTTQSTRRRFPTLAVGLFESTWAERFAPPGLLARYRMDDMPDTVTADADWVQGSALMVRRAVIDAIGGLDEGYRMYSEELDWCKRAKDAGWRVVYAADAHIIHHGGRSSDQAAAQRHIDFQQSKLRYFRKFHGPAAAAVLRAWLLVQYALQLVFETGKWLLGHKRTLRAARIAAYRRVLATGLHADGGRR
jgi:GT2 family glycosyltransferase